MFSQHESGQLPPPPAHPDLAEIRTWLAAWPQVRGDVERLLEDAVHQAAGHDTAPFLTLIDEVDASMRLLRHRVEWLNEQLLQHER